MSYIGQNRSFFPVAKPSLPVSLSDSKQDGGGGGGGGGLRRRLSSMSLNLKIPANPAASSWSFPRSKSLSSMGDYAGTSLRKWWDWSWAWILSRKPIFATDLEMNQQEAKLLGSHDRGTWRHVFCRVRSEIRRFVTSDDYAASLPQTARRTIQAS